MKAFILDVSTILDKNKITEDYKNDQQIISDISKKMVEYAIDQMYDVKINWQEMKQTSYGKPYIENSDIYFNISHSGSYILCAVGNEEVGVDIEGVHKFSESLKKKNFNTKRI